MSNTGVWDLCLGERGVDTSGKYPAILAGNNEDAQNWINLRNNMQKTMMNVDGGVGICCVFRLPISDSAAFAYHEVWSTLAGAPYWPSRFHKKDEILARISKCSR